MNKICFERINKIGQTYFGNIREHIIDIQNKKKVVFYRHNPLWEKLNTRRVKLH